VDATIAVLAGDGIGPEVTGEAVRVLEAIASRFGHRFRFEPELIGGAAIAAVGAPLPDATLATCRSADAVLLGAVGGPRWDGPGVTVRPEQGLLQLRRALDVYANLRPVRVTESLIGCSTLKPEVVRGVDLVIVRELTGGLYFGTKERRPHRSGAEAIEECRYSTGEIERVARHAGRLARARRGKVTSVDKANVLETSRLWRETVTGVMDDEFADLELNHLLVDACAMHLLRDPRSFDVVVTENLFGDILSDEAAMLVGSIGMLPSASLGDPGRPGVFEPIHGSAPDLARTGRANPSGAILSAALLLRHGLGLTAEAATVERAVESAWRAGCRSADLAPVGAAWPTEAIGREVAARIVAAEHPVAVGS
jgi:3-isopropylmalate dehydrogenase